MKIFSSFLAQFAIYVANAGAQNLPALLFDPPDGTVPPPVREVRAAFKPAEVMGTTVHRQGGRDVIVQHLALDPADPVKPVVPAPPAPRVPLPQQEIHAPAAPFHFNMLSATVYAGPRTRVQWTSLAGGGKETWSGWSNVDFNHFGGIGTFLGTDGEEHSFLWGISTETEPPHDAPVFETQAPTFILDGKNIPTEAMIFMDSLHKLYAIEHEKLAAAHASRARAEAVRRAELLANPPQPKDLVIRYRIAETPLPTQPEGWAE